MKHITERKQGSGGFTLIELLVVVLIVGIIASIALVAIEGAILSARVASVAADLHSFESGFVRYDMADDLSASHGPHHYDFDLDGWSAGVAVGIRF